MKLSVVIPVFNEGDAVHEAHAKVSECLRRDLSDWETEIIFVDDGSRDDSFSHLSRLAVEHPGVKVLKLVSNVGAHMAVRAGMDACSGDYAVFLACDLQDPPELVSTLLARCVGEVQVVWAVRASREDSWSSKLFSAVFFALARLMVSRNLPPSGSSMMLLGPKALKVLRSYTERNLTLDGFLSTAGFQMDYVPIDRKARQSGVSKWTLGKKLKFALDFFTGYSYVPIRAMSLVGVLTAILGMAYAAIVVIRWMADGIDVPGWTSLMVALLIVSGVQMCMLGVLGEYVWRGLDETRKRPRYIVDTALGFTSPDQPGMTQFSSLSSSKPDGSGYLVENQST
ncbi:glycosyltransferase family 2 protein [Magnetospirillum aberrantis]|uniref:Glycosyltransferase family 2 protein n=1 Tax=Magnetospirillum aberrantis SpK TaxID=908842 RepID=A0A7C9UYM9_9PROT|nr:glycosyltransferase family 2 protein [Magnetospirillum aberrantis]NFV79714.1 glycosyltransferase family 2 protein [Magnetospirillum aberrantis SpK]